MRREKKATLHSGKGWAFINGGKGDTVLNGVEESMQRS